MIILTGPTVYTENEKLTKTSVVIEENKIHAILNQDQAIKQFPSAEKMDFPEAYHMIPGFIDMHIHGAHGKDVMDANDEALHVISQTLAKEGTTAFLATTMTAEKQAIENALIHVRNHMQHPSVGAEILGAHLEGPFISKEKTGAQSVQYIIPPNVADLQYWQAISENAIKLVTLAPEIEHSEKLIHYLKQQQIIAAMGHSNATYQQAMSAITAGCSYATHLFNAMRGIHQREPGIITAALMSEKMNVELIADGVHVHPALIDLVYKIKGKDKIILITDAMRAKCLCDGRYDLGGQTVEVKNAIPRLVDGTLAGSVLTMSTALKNILAFSGCDLTDAITMTSVNPAKALGVFTRKGSIAERKDADLVILNEAMQVVMTICGGKIFR